MDTDSIDFSSDGEHMENAPSINERQRLNCLKDGSLVQFRAMVQDMFDPEFYLDEYEVIETHSGQSRMKSGRFRDVISCEPDLKVNLESSKNVTLERNIYYCVAIPWENDWVVKISFSFVDKNPSSSSDINNSTAIETSTNCNSKRRQDDLESDCSSLTITSQHPVVMDTLNSKSEDDSKINNKRSKIGDIGPVFSQDETSTTPLNDVAVSDDTVACIVKVYGNTMDRTPIALNECFNFYGILSVDPCLAIPDVTNSLDENDQMDIELQGHHPPPSKVPRLHVIKAVKLTHNNPLIPPEVTAWQPFLKDAAQVRVHLHSILTQVFDGDSLTADYLICHLVSSIYIRQNVFCLGKFSLNLTNVHHQDDFVKRFYDEIIKKITTKSYFLSLTMSTLNGKSFVPSKDYVTNKLRSGLLQLSFNTHLIIDETQMTSGRLDKTGVKNVAAIKELITWQKLSYDFQYNSLEFNTDVPVLLFSQGKSLFPADYVLPLEGIRADNESKKNEQLFESVCNYLTPNLLDTIRIYLSAIKFHCYEMSEDIQRIIEDDFVSIRRENNVGMTTDDLHSLLVLTRLLSLSYGQTSPSVVTWEQAKSLEVERKARLSRQTT